jgi:predicted Ser/Thr protein kinase
VSLLPPGSRIGRFEISLVLGEGAMGVVYLAHDPQIERPVAIKTLRPQGSMSSAEELKERFLKEAKLAGRLQHPNIVTIYEAGQDEGVLYIAMEFVDGQPLTRYLRAPDSLSLRERVEIVREVALALEHAHGRGVLHRDVKPGNILITRERRVKVADFGIGKLLSGTAADLTRTGQMIGSPAYMSPEQIRGEKLDGRSDFFSLGVVFYELMTGARPFPGDSITTLVYQILHTEPRDPLEIRADLPPAAREVFARLLAKAPDKRPVDGPDFLRETRRIADQLGDAEQTIAFAAPVPSAATAPASIPPSPAQTLSSEASATGAATAASTGSAAAAPAPPIPPSRPAGGLILFGIAALLLALAIFLVVWRRAPSPTETASARAARPPVAATSPLPTAVRVELTVLPTPPPAPTLGPRPTPGPAGAADAVVGAPRYTGLSPVPTRVARPTLAEPRVAVLMPSPEVIAESRPSHESAGAPVPDNVYRTRKYAKMSVSPDQARMYVDGRYVGIADDWDDRGGGKKFEFQREGSHRVRFELPGHRDLNLEILVTSGAGDDTADIGDELKRESRVPYPKLGSPTERTVGPVVFEADPRDATVTEGTRTLGPASAFTNASPLKLTGPMVHDLVFSAPGRKSKTVRVLVAPNADNDVARVKVELKKE